MQQLNLADLETAHRVAAQLVARDGPEFLPVFERLDAELKAFHQREARLVEVTKIAEKGAE